MYHKNNPLKHRNSVLKYKFGITLKEYDNMFEVQLGKCLICKKAETSGTSSGKIKRLSVDHNHVTGKTRGLLCGQCNKKLGFVEDAVWLTSALEYLKIYEGR